MPEHTHRVTYEATFNYALCAGCETQQYRCQLFVIFADWIWFLLIRLIGYTILNFIKKINLYSQL